MGNRICSTPDCGAEVVYTSRGQCKRCYRRTTRPLKGGIRISTPNIARFEARLAPGLNGCWTWVGGRGGGERRYGTFTLAGRIKVYAHRWSYEYHRAEIPKGLEIDHLCRNTLCVNPWHLEPVTPEVNKARSSNALKTHCAKGHEFTPENTYVRKDRKGRQCRKCRNAAVAKARREREAPAADR